MSEQRASQRKHLEFVQDIIKRQAQNSFSMKGWSITLASAVFAILLRQDPQPASFLIIILPAILFWILDAYYLRQERLFRKLYGAIANDIREELDPPVIKPLEMDTSGFIDDCPWWHSARSISTVLIPITTIGTAVVLAVIVTLTNTQP